LILYVPGRRGGSSPSPGVFSVAIPRCVHRVHHVVKADHEALACGIVAFGVGGVGVAEPLVHNVEEPLENHRIRHAG
jgi:hypothetical protein